MNAYTPILTPERIGALTACPDILCELHVNYD